MEGISFLYLGNGLSIRLNNRDRKIAVFYRKYGKMIIIHVVDLYVYSLLHFNY